MSGVLLGFGLSQAWLLGLGLWARWQQPHFSPAAWVGLIGASLLPSLVILLIMALPEASHSVAYAIGKPSGEAQSLAPDPGSSGVSWATIALSLYILVTLVLLARLGRPLLRLRRLARGAEPIAHDVHLVDTHLPPLALGWPDRTVLIGQTTWDGLGDDERAMLLAHERVHLAARDPEMTLVLLGLSNLVWFNPGLRLLVDRWRGAIEMRADAQAARTDPNTYSRLLLRLSRAHGLPLPTATHGDLHMRISTLFSNSHPQRAPRLAIALAALVSAGAMTLSAVAADAPQPTKRVPPMMPEVCPGLDFSVIGLELQAQTLTTYDNKERVIVSGDAIAKVGEVVLRFDVSADGRPTNIEILRSNADCFRAPATEALRQWRYEEGIPVKAVSNTMRFVLSFEDGADAKAELDAFSGN